MFCSTRNRALTGPTPVRVIKSRSWVSWVGGDGVVVVGLVAVVVGLVDGVVGVAGVVSDVNSCKVPVSIIS